MTDHMTDAIADAAMLGRSMSGARTLYLRATARSIAADWRDVTDLDPDLALEAANAICQAAQCPSIDVALVAMSVLEDRRVRFRDVYRWPEVDAETVDAMAVRAARVWRQREGE